MSDAVDILEAMDEAHRAAELEDLARTLDVAPRPLRARSPEGGRLPASEAAAERWRAAVGGDVSVLDDLRCFGPWAVSIDEAPHSYLDLRGHLPEGFASSPIVRQYVGGAMGTSLLFADDASAVDALGDALRAALPDHPAVTLVANADEALELALGEHPPSAVVTFEGGRTSAEDPVPFPVWRTPNEPVDDPEWARSITKEGAGALDGLAATDALLAAELASLRAVRERDDHVVVIEPVQSVGEHHATPRFFRALRALTSAMGARLVFDETESGFGPSGRPTWHRRFALHTPADHVVFGGRAGVGILMSRGTKSTLAEHPLDPAALWRATMLASQRHAKDARRAQAECLPRLEALAGRFPDLLMDPRALAYSVAFELPTRADRDAFVKHALQRGALVDPTGERTIRFRLGRMFATRHIDLTFDATRAALKLLEAGSHAPSEVESHRAKSASPIKTRVRQVGADEAEFMLGRIVALEAAVYEPARRDSESKLRKAFDDPAGIAIVAEALAEDVWRLVGFSLAAPLEHVEVEGIPDDPRRAAGDTLYALSTTLDPASQGHGLGLRMKQAMVTAARMMRREDGTPRYRHMSGRNRVGVTGAMQRVNARLGAYVITVLENQYGGTGSARYYQMPIGPLRPAAPKAERALDMSRGLHLPFVRAPQTLLLAAERGGLFGPAVQPSDLAVAVTPSAVRAVEYITALSPLPRLHLASSSRDAARVATALLKQIRPQAEISLALVDGGDDLPGDVRRCRVDEMAARVASLGAENVLAIFVECLGARTGAVLDVRQITLLRNLRAKTGVPLAAVETATAYFRSGRGAFACAELEPDLILWWGGGQAAFVHAPIGLDRVASSPDELSLVRVHHQLRAARSATPDWDAFARALEPLGSRGLGGYRVVQDASPELERRFVDAGLAPRRVGDALAFVPPLDADADALVRLRRASGELGLIT